MEMFSEMESFSPQEKRAVWWHRGEEQTRHHGVLPTMSKAVAEIVL
jgi:hypothetical protein